MNRILIIARHEFIKFVTRRGFLFTLVGVPLWIALAAIVPAKLSSAQNRQAIFAVVDRSGAFTPALSRAVDRRNAREPERFVLADTPPALLRAAPEKFAAIARNYLGNGKEDAKFDAIVVIPKDFDAAHPAEFWSSRNEDALRDFVQTALTSALRLRAVHRLGDPRAAAALDVEAAVRPRNPSAGLPSAIKGIASVSVAVGMAILLLIVAIMNSMALLQGVIEEKSTRMIEVLLSCATPWEIVTGKILGVIAVALFTIVIWVGSAAILGSVFAGSMAAGMIHGALDALSDPVLTSLVILYFLCGLLIYGAIFLIIGSMSASLADAQAYLGPSMMIIMLPNLFIAAILNAPNGALATAASYFPVYTPYIMLMRVGSHPPAIELVTTALLSVGVAAFLVWKAGQTFARHALTTEKPPRMGSLFSRFRKSATAE
ncbi:MAG TPA: ABC transporter permease [Rhizomicrobium sp.]|jgi:ABC-2 type transport system permease protein